MLITETELRAHWHKTKAATITLAPGSLLTPSARDFLRAQDIRVEIVGQGPLDLGQQPLATARAHKAAAAGGKGTKPEHMTHLYGGQLVAKTHPVIAWRGQLDLFDCALVETQVALAQAGEEELAEALEEVAAFARRLMVAEVRRQPAEFGDFFGWTVEEIHEMSHHPDRYFGIPHTPMSYRDGFAVARLHLLRSKAREVELYANRAFDGEGGEGRPDIILALNRLSSLFYILICQRRGRTGDKRLTIGVSNRHVHLSAADLEALFGKGYSLSVHKELSQPGQFAAAETVKLVGPRGAIGNVRILGPVRKKTQVEISTTDSFVLGVKPVVRDSGQLDGSAGLKLVGPRGAIELSQGVIVAARHIHLEPEQAKKWQLHDGQRVRVRIDSERPLVLGDVLVRVSPEYRGELHLDTDEANAALAKNGTQAVILGV